MDARAAVATAVDAVASIAPGGLPVEVAGLLGVLAAVQQLRNRLDALVNDVLVAVARVDDAACRADFPDVDFGADFVGRVAEYSQAPELVAPCLGVSVHVAQNRVLTALELAQRAPVLVEEMRAGRVEAFRAGLLHRELADAPAAVEEEIVARLVVRADRVGGWVETAGPLLRRARSLLATLAPDVLAARVASSRDLRGLHKRGESESLDRWDGLYHVEDSRMAWAAIDDLAHELLTAGAAGTLAQARADAHMRLLLEHCDVTVHLHATTPGHALTTPATSPAPAAGSAAAPGSETTRQPAARSDRQQRRPVMRPDEHTMPEPQPGRDQGPGAPASPEHAAVPAEQAAELVPWWEDGEGDGPEGLAPHWASTLPAGTGSWSQIESTMPAPTASAAAPAVETADLALWWEDGEGDGPERVAPHWASTLAAGTGPRSQIASRMPEPSWRAAASAASEAESSAGPVPAVVEVGGFGGPGTMLVRRQWLKDALATGRAVLDAPVRCHPDTGAVLDGAIAKGFTRATTRTVHGDETDPRYRIPEPMARLVRFRDRQCRFPGCAISSRFCDLDHVLAWPAGPTSPANLMALCRRHHRLKQTPGWMVTIQPDLTVTWTDPIGRTHTSYPTDHLGLPEDWGALPSTSETTPSADPATPGHPWADIALDWPPPSSGSEPAGADPCASGGVRPLEAGEPGGAGLRPNDDLSPLEAHLTRLLAA